MKENTGAAPANYTVVATKLSKPDKEKLKEIASRFGLSFYELLQALLLATVRYFDASSAITEEHAALMEAFSDTLFSTKESFCPLSNSRKETRSVRRALLFVEQEQTKRPQVLEVSRTPDGDLRESYNYNTIIEGVLGAIDPEALQKLNGEKRRRGDFSLLHTLHDVIIQAEREEDTSTQEIKELFSDIRTGDGTAIEENVYYKRKHREWKASGIPTPRARRVCADF